MRGIAGIAALVVALVMIPGLAGAQGKSAVVVVRGAGLYELPFMGLGPKAEVAPKTPVRILDQKGSWYIVRAADLVGWMQKHTIRFTGSSSRVAQATTTSSPRSYRLTPKGNCYYYSNEGAKVFVERSMCG